MPPCAECGRPTVSKKFCSDECRTKARQKRQAWAKANTCVICGKPARVKYCSDACYNEAHRQIARARYTPKAERKPYVRTGNERGPSLDFRGIDDPWKRLMIAMVYNAKLEDDREWLETWGVEIALTIAPDFDTRALQGD